MFQLPQIQRNLFDVQFFLFVLKEILMGLERKRRDREKKKEKRERGEGRERERERERVREK